jgi:hypothetical protein
MSWIYEQKEFIEEMIPEGAVGFVYQMDVILDGARKSYIGKKNFFADVKTKLSKKALSTDKRKKTYKRVRKTVYQNYYSSNESLKTAHKAGVLIRRTILKICYSKTELSYQEVKYQFQYEVLEHDNFLNANILGRFYKQKK